MWWIRGRFQVTVINLMGVVYMEPLACPFETLDRLLEEAGHPKFCVVDFHAEATAEKKALAYYADGGYPPFSAPIPMCRRPMDRSCQRGPASSPTQA